jgi:hypothetical protein
MTSTVTRTTHEISVRGRVQEVPAYVVDGAVVVVTGSALQVAEVFDAYWLEAAALPDPAYIAKQLGQLRRRPDLFTFTQRAPETHPTCPFHLEWDNVAAIPISTHEEWFQKQISSASRRNIRASEKKGVTVRTCAFDEAYIRGIMSVSDESPIRAGRRYWHYGKDFATVEREQGTYRERATFLAAYVGDEMVGYLKMVWDAQTAAIMQIVSKMEFRDRRPNNALLSEAVRQCAARGVQHLLYERYVYGTKVDSSLTRFKRENGFVRMDLPCYFVPLTLKGRLALAAGLHRNLKDRLPEWLTKHLIAARDKWNARGAAVPELSKTSV